MSEILRAFDPNFARRQLHDVAFEAAEAFGRGGVPHTYDSDALCDHARKLTKRREIARSEFYAPLLLRTGIVACLLGDAGDGCDLFARGIHDADSPPDQALFHYAIAHWVHLRAGDKQTAKRLLLKAHEESERRRRVRTEIELLLGRMYRAEGEYEAAERMYHHVLDRGVLEFQSLAHLYLAVVYMRKGDLRRARAENQTGLKLVTAADGWRVPMIYRSNLAEIHALEENYERSRELLEQIIEERFHRLDIDELAKAYNNHALVCRQLGDVESARRAFARSVHYHASVSLPGRVSGSYVNLARMLIDEEETDVALAALERAIEAGRAAKTPVREFTALAVALGAARHSPTATRAIPAILSRCRAIIAETGGQVPREALVEFVQATESVGAHWGSKMVRSDSPTSLATVAARRELTRLVDSVSEPDLGSTLEGRIGPGMEYDDAPSPIALRRFLMLYLGDSFKSMSYQREFGRSQSRAKYHLQWLVARRVLERVGTRKASAYMLAFHRRSA